MNTTNELKLQFDSKSINEGFSRVAKHIHFSFSDNTLPHAKQLRGIINDSTSRSTPIQS